MRCASPPDSVRADHPDLAFTEVTFERRGDKRREDGDGNEVEESHPEGGELRPQRKAGIARAERHGDHPGEREPERHATSRIASSSLASPTDLPRVSQAPSRLPATPVTTIGTPPEDICETT